MTNISIRNSSGTELSQAVISDITIKNDTKSSVIPLPGTNKDVIQKFGKRNRIFTVEGIVYGTTGVSFIDGLYGTTGSFYYSSSALNYVIVNTVTVFFKDTSWKDKGSRPMERLFSIEMVEVL